MARLFLVRHGEAAASWTDHQDAGLSDRGEAQAHAVAVELAARLEPGVIRSSPLLRTQLTARPLAERWGSTVLLDSAYTEVPSPSPEPSERRAWLSAALVSNWDDLGAAVTTWRARLLEAAAATSEDTIVFTHFVAINALIAAALDRPETVTFAPGNASVTEIDVGAAGELAVVHLGAEATPEVG